MRYLMWTVLAMGVMLAVQGVVQANDTVRLGGPSAQAAIQGGTDSQLVHWWPGRLLARAAFGHGYYGRSYYGGGYYGGGYYGGYYGGGYAGYYRPYYGYASYYRPYYASSYYAPYYGGGYYNSYSYSSYYTPYVSYGYPSYCYSIAGNVATNAPVMTLQQSTYVAPQPSTPIQQPTGDGTYPYDGGPRQVVPMPPASNTAPKQMVPMPPARDFPAPVNQRPNVPLDGKFVSMPRETTGGVSAVFTPAIQGWKTVSTSNNNVQASPAPTRIVYPAYGDNIVPTPRKTTNR